MPKRARPCKTRGRKRNKSEGRAACPAWKQCLLTQLDKLLTERQAESVFVAAASSLTTGRQLRELRDAYSQDGLGLIVLTDAVSEESLQKADGNLRKAVVGMWQEQLSANDVKHLLFSGVDIGTILNRYRNSVYGFGNASFGYLYKQFPAEYVYNVIEGERVALDTNYVYAHVNLPLLLDNPHTTTLLLALSAQDAMVSWDSAKLASDPSPKPDTMTAQTYTVPHVDLYEDEELQRRQAIINDDQQVKLFYVPGSHCSMARLLIAHILEQPTFYEGTGYRALSDPDLLQVLYKHAVAAPPKSLALWKSGVIHFEGRASPTPLPNSLYSFQDREAGKNARRLRFVVGTQKPVNLSKHSRMQLALLAEYGLLPAVYPGVNKGTKVHRNTVNRKKSLWKRPRPMPETELWRIKAAALVVEEHTNMEASFQKQVSQPLKRHLYGVSQHRQTLPLSVSDQSILQQIFCE